VTLDRVEEHLLELGAQDTDVVMRFDIRSAAFTPRGAFRDWHAGESFDAIGQSADVAGFNSDTCS
jgi:hypothetical protein